MNESGKISRFQYLLAGLVFLGVGIFLITQAGYTERFLNLPIISSIGNRTPEKPNGFALTQSAPVKISIPKINIEADFVDLGITGNNEIEVPETTTEVGWYKFGPTPGELGPAIVLGHVDSKTGPGVFFYLGQLEPGDRIDITRADGTIAQFQVDGLERYDQSFFPTSLVYGDIEHAGLRLITCSGSYDRKQRRYDHNLVVYASLIEPPETTPPPEP